MVTEGPFTFERAVNGDITIKSSSGEEFIVDAGCWASTVLNLTAFGERPNDWHRFMEWHQGTRDIPELTHPWNTK